MNIFITILLAIPVNADNSVYNEKLGIFRGEEKVLKEVLQWFVNEEYLDKDYSGWFLYINMPEEDFANNCRVLRTNYEKLHDAPLSITIIGKLPNIEEIRDKLAFNKQFEEYLIVQKMIHIDKAEILDKALNETKKLYTTWDIMLRIQQQGWASDVHKRSYIKDLVDRIGIEAYYAGRMPPHIPFSLFAPID